MMNCPKCNTKMCHYTGPSMASGLRDGSPMQCLSGWQCPPHGCGKWIEDEFVPAATRPFQKGNLSGQRRNNTKLTGTSSKGDIAREKIRANFDEIKYLVNHKPMAMSWKDICQKYEIDIHYQIAARKYYEIKRERMVRRCREQ